MPCGAKPISEEDMQYYENYDPSKPVCDNQDDFNQALDKGIRYAEKRRMDKSKPWIYIYAIIWVILAVWALLIAIRTKSGQDRVMHIYFAILMPPIYLVAYYLSMFDIM